MMALNKTCRYCPYCDLLITHQDEIETLLAPLFAGRKPQVIKDYLIIGTLERAAWRQGCKTAQTMDEMLENMHDFKDVLKIEVTGGWGRW